ncbi:MAG TPA: TfoX/Sxy family protein [Vicinamibacterales bacterium]|nr:TfoX/Sxy family protein [Vicinamibacterales bacterium]
MPRTRRSRSPGVSDTFKTFVLDQLGELGDVTPRAMFGGVGLYYRGIFFALIARDVLYMKVDDRNRVDYEQAGMGPFRPYPGKSGVMQYYAVPPDVLESGFELAKWARKSVAAAERSQLTPRARDRARGRG